MKKFVCMAMAAMLAMGTVPAYAVEDFFVDIPHIFTAKVGTTEFTKDGESQPLDVPVYIKDGYTMLPLRTFMTAALEKATMHWENGTASVLYGYHIISFDVKNNKIMKNGKELPVYGKMEIRDGRVFVPLRNWGNILQVLGYIVTEEDITWNSAEKLAAIYAVEQKLDTDRGLEKPVISGEGQEAEFVMEMTTDYDELENVGNGNFIAQKYAEGGFGLGEGVYSRDNQYIVLNIETGKIKTYDVGTSLREVREEWTQTEKDMETDSDAECADRCMKGLYRSEQIVELPDGEHAHVFTYHDETGEISYEEYQLRKGLSEGLAPWYDAKLKKYGYVNAEGVWIIAPAFDKSEPFEDSYAVVANEITLENGEKDVEWGIIEHPNK